MDLLTVSFALVTLSRCLSHSSCLSLSSRGTPVSAFFTAFLLIYAACHENSHGTEYEKIREGGLKKKKKSHHIQLRDFLVHSRVRENKQIAADEGGEKKSVSITTPAVFPGRSWT